MPCFSLSRLLQLSFIHPSIAATTTNINKTTEIRRQRTKPTKENNKEQRRRRTTLFKHSQADSHIQTHVTGTTFTLLVACLRTDKNSKYTHGYTTNTHDEIIKNTFMVFIIIFSFHYCLSFISFSFLSIVVLWGMCIVCSAIHFFSFRSQISEFSLFIFISPLKIIKKIFAPYSSFPVRSVQVPWKRFPISLQFFSFLFCHYICAVANLPK